MKKLVLLLVTGLALAGPTRSPAQTISATEPGAGESWTGLEGPPPFPPEPPGLLGSGAPGGFPGQGSQRPPMPPPGFQGFVFGGPAGSYELADLHLGPPPGAPAGAGTATPPPPGGMLRIGDRAYLLGNMQMTPYQDPAAAGTVSAGRTVVATFQAQLYALPPPPADGSTSPASPPAPTQAGIIQGALVRVVPANQLQAPAIPNGPGGPGGPGAGLVVEAQVQTDSISGTLLARAGGPGHGPHRWGHRGGRDSRQGGM